MISLAITSLIVVMILGTLRFGIRAWEKGEKNIESNQRRRIVLSLIKQQLASVCVHKILNGGKSHFYLNGDATFVEFVSTVSIVPGNKFGKVYVKYVITQDEETEKKQLAFYEKNIVLLEKEEDFDKPDEEEFYPILSEADNIAFEYLDPTQEEEFFEWQEEWNTDEVKKFPLAVKILFRESSDGYDVSVIAGIQSDPDV